MTDGQRDGIRSTTARLMRGQEWSTSNRQFTTTIEGVRDDGRDA